MAKAQYRVNGTLDWQYQSGNAILAIYNPVGSGKKLTINSFEANNLTASNVVAAPTATSSSALLLVRGTADCQGAPQITGIPMDSNNTWPSSVMITKGGVVTSTTTIRRIIPNKQLNPAGAATYLGMYRNAGARRVRPSLFLTAKHRAGTSPVEPVVVRAGESVALIPDPATIRHALPFVVDVTLLRGTQTWQFTTFTHSRVGDMPLLCIENTAGSGETIKVLDVSVSEVGTFDSPYFQVVPLGPLNATSAQDASRQVTVFKMDSDYPAAPFVVYQNVNIDPFGMPAKALSDGSAGSPKGFNYLATKDFLGPVYRTVFPEGQWGGVHAAPSATSVGSDTFGNVSHWGADLMFRRAGITIREGEGIALVSGAETATITSAVGVSGWSSWEFGAQITAESRYAPTLSFTGLQPGTEVRVFRTSDGVELAGTESSGTSFSYNYEWDGADLQVDIVLHHINYLPIRYAGQYLGSGGLSIPVQQTFDRNYTNP